MNHPPEPPAVPPFSQATGFVAQSVGIVLALGACCWWSFSGRIQDELQPTTPSAAVVEVRRDAAPEQLAAMLAVCVNFAGGLALCVLGLGAQHGRRSAARWLKWTCAAAALYFACYLAGAVFWFPREFGRIALGVVMALVWTALFLLAGASDEALRHAPVVPLNSSWTKRDEDDLRKSDTPR